MTDEGIRINTRSHDWFFPNSGTDPEGMDSHRIGKGSVAVPISSCYLNIPLMKVFLNILLAASLLLLTGCQREDLYGNLTEADANEMLGLLLARGVDAAKVQEKAGKFTLVVPKNQFAEAVDTLQWFGLPKQQYSSLGDLFQKSGMVSSPTEERVRYVYGLSQTIAETLSNIGGVITSRVNLVLPDNDPFSGGIKPSSASVFLKVRPGLVSTTLVPQIKNLVMNSVEGLSYDRITVTVVQADSIDYFFPVKGDDVRGKFFGVAVPKSRIGVLWGILGGALAAGMLIAVVGVMILSGAERGFGIAALGNLFRKNSTKTDA
jgi:type III secretion protein J